MSGKTARMARQRQGLKRQKKCPVKDAKRIYANVILELMAECGINEHTSTKDEIELAIAECSDEFLPIYDEYLTDILYDGDRDAVEFDLAMSKLTGKLPILLGNA